jgi:hypothetical protein
MAVFAIIGDYFCPFLRAGKKWDENVVLDTIGATECAKD